MPFISIVTPCYNEEENVELLYQEVKSVLEQRGSLEYEHIFIDNCSKDRTVERLKILALKDKHVKIIVNSRNFGPTRSPLHGLFQAKGEAIIPMAADFQDWPGVIPQLLEKWMQGYKVVVAVKEFTEESWPMSLLRRLYYQLVSFLSEGQLIKNFTGFGLYDKSVIDAIRRAGDYRPYFRGLVCDWGEQIAQIKYPRPLRKRGKSKNRFYDLYSEGMLGITAQSQLPLRVAVFFGASMAVLSALVGIGYFIYKLMYWNEFSVGMAPLVIGVFLLASLQMFFLGILGEYVASIQSRVSQKWLVIESERINFDDVCASKQRADG